MSKEGWIKFFNFLEKIRTSWIFIALLSIILIFLFFQIILNISKAPQKPLGGYAVKENSNASQEKQNIPNNSEKIPTENSENSNATASRNNNRVSGGGGGGSGGGSSGDGDVISEVNPNPPKNIPDDVYIVPCGTYFFEDSICAGTCPTGTCVNEGRSCYCKV